MNGAQAVWYGLRRERVEVVFGFPGGKVVPLYDALPGSGIRHVLVRHEQGAALMAGGYARASGRVGLAVATSGPGATNLVTGLADAQADSIPIVCLTGQVPTSMIGTDAFQECDILGISSPIVKHSYLVREVDDLLPTIAEAFAVAQAGRPGPVLIDIPQDVQTAELTVSPTRWANGNDSEDEQGRRGGDDDRRRADMNGAECILECLKREGVEVVFGYPGGAVIPLYDALNKVDIQHILVRHEQGAALMAGGYARASGKVGVAFATSGPGVTNLVTGIADAHMDSVPIVCITGQVPRSMIGKDSFQETDATGITLPIVKHSYLVRTVDELPRIIAEAFHIAQSGRPGPVLVDIPKDIQFEAFDGSFEVPRETLRGYQVQIDPDPDQLAAAADLLNSAERPALYVGGGAIAAGAKDELVKFAEMGNIPVTWTLMGKGAFPEDHPLAVGMLGMHGAAYANYTITRCDVMIVVGARFDDRVTGKLATFAPQAKVIHVDIDPAELGKNRIPVVGVRADVKAALQGLTPRLKPEIDRAPWAAQIAEWKAKHPLVAHRQKATGEIRPQYLLEELTRITGGEAIVSTDVGQHQMWAAQFYQPREPRLFLTSGGLGTMGFGFPAAIGAWFACPEKENWLVTGDGSFQMNLQELAVAVINKVPVKVMMINNGYLGMVRQWQELFHDRNYSETWLHTQPGEGDPVISPDFVKLFEAYGAKAIRVFRNEEVDDALAWAQNEEGPVLIDFIVHEEENVWPMVPAGGDTGEPILEPEGVDA